MQARAQRCIEEFGVQDLYYSPLPRAGILPLDRIVVRAIEGHSDSYVVAEGNRASLPSGLVPRIDQGTITGEGIDTEYLQDVKESIAQIEVSKQNPSKMSEWSAR